MPYGLIVDIGTKTEVELNDVRTRSGDDEEHGAVRHGRQRQRTNVRECPEGPTQQLVFVVVEHEAGVRAFVLGRVVDGCRGAGGAAVRVVLRKGDLIRRNKLGLRSLGHNKIKAQCLKGQRTPQGQEFMPVRIKYPQTW